VEKTGKLTTFTLPFADDSGYGVQPSGRSFIKIAKKMNMLDEQGGKLTKWKKIAF
jgi:hypothetical protein